MAELTVLELDSQLPQIGKHELVELHQRNLRKSRSVLQKSEKDTSPKPEKQHHQECDCKNWLKQSICCCRKKTDHKNIDDMSNLEITKAWLLIVYFLFMAVVYIASQNDKMMFLRATIHTHSNKFQESPNLCLVF